MAEKKPIPQAVKEAVKVVQAATPGEVKQHIETKVDRLIREVAARKGMTVLEAASLLGVEVRTIENWGNILEDHQLLKLHYPAFGKPVLLPPGQPEPAARKKKEILPKRMKQNRKMTRFLVLLVLAIVVIIVAIIRRSGRIELPPLPRDQPIFLVIPVGLFVLAILLFVLRNKIRYWHWKQRMGLLK
ncbi:MAG: hypothetical protein KKA90_01685 [Nanoarchaeota archaeon]|nr:hypothetical protein [Nanoarchaeota archaeon]